MFNSKWQISRIGLVDFWYYDEEEFQFRDGRMLLRGSNGSGKSVTMQSFIPLLLDGNMRPERLDPFGSRARKMENYLLEEGDEREERTGYLYMEFKRQDGQNYLTLGIGLRARKNKKLDTWYFTIDDGRRIGEDFWLYKDIGSKIAYTKQELKNRLGEGGRIFESQNEYMEQVNRLLFGFETIEQYKELLELLIQLRTPKLSKDFKPTVINDILSSALQTLSEDDLRPMSEAIENMDTLKTNLDSLEQALQAARQIQRVYAQYNETVLYQKADNFAKASKDIKNNDADRQQVKQQTADMQQKLAAEEKRYEGLRQEESVLSEEQRSLSESDAARLKEQELKLRQELRDGAAELQRKSEQEADKAGRQHSLEQDRQAQENEREEQFKIIYSLLEDMAVLTENVSFDEFAFLEKALSAQKDEGHDFLGHHHLLANYRQKVEAGLSILQEEEREHQRCDEQAQTVDELRQKRERSERELLQYRDQLQEIRSELVEALYRWSRENQELILPETALQQLSRMVDAFGADSDYADLKAVARLKSAERQELLHRELRPAIDHQSALEEALAKKEAELTDWQNKKEPEPERSEVVKQARTLLMQKGIPYQPFYKTVDFVQGLSEDLAARLEEALLHMGLLDALIVPSEYREQVLALGPGVCDHYIFGDATGVEHSLHSCLSVDNPDQDIFREQNIAGILQSIGLQQGAGTAATWICADGSYRMGILEGTVTQEYQPQFIGAQAREAYRQRMLQKLAQEREILMAEKAAADEIAAQLHARLERLQLELDRFPAGDDLKVAAKDHEQAQYRLQQWEQQLCWAVEKLDKLEKAMTAIRLEAQTICSKAYLAPRLDVFKQAKIDLAEYHNALTQLENSWTRQLSARDQSSQLGRALEDAEQDLDNIRYELGGLERQQALKKLKLRSVQEQLELTDYKQVKERLDICTQRLQEIPRQREQAKEAAATLKSKLEAADKEWQLLAEKRLQLLQRKAYLEQGFIEEYQLKYVERHFVVNEDWEDQAKKVCQMLSAAVNKSLSDVTGNFQESYHANRGYLLDYNLSLRYLFEEMVEEEEGYPSLKRLDITAKYHGIKVSFLELLSKLEQDKAELANLLSDKDRELFEDILANTISKKIRVRIYDSQLWVEKMNSLMESMVTSSGLRLSLKWKSKRAETEEQLDTRTLVALLQKDVEIMREEEVEDLSRHFRSKIAQARKLADDKTSEQSFHAIMREILDYRQWFEFQLEYQKTGEAKKELTDRAFFTFSGGEKAMSMYVPLFSAVVAKYDGARSDAPRIISLDEAFAGVDEMNIKDMFRLMVSFEFNFIINSQALWGDYETVPALAIYQLIRPENAKYVTVIPYVWNGQVRLLAEKEGGQADG